MMTTVDLLEFGITRREQEVLEGLTMNLTNKEIGARLNITERTVKFHMSNLIAKFKTDGRMGVVLRYLKGM